MKTIPELLDMIEDADQKKACLAFYAKYEALFNEMPASAYYHHSFVGGYGRHICEVMNNVVSLMTNIDMMEKVDFTLDDGIIGGFMHDADKLFYRYELDTEKPSDGQVKYAQGLGVVIEAHESKTSISAKIDAAKSGKPLDPLEIHYFKNKDEGYDFDDGAIVCRICYEHGIKLSESALAAICHHHGGWAPVLKSNGKAQICKLGVILHCADLWSSHLQNGRTT
jgi:hypothetical protein